MDTADRQRKKLIATTLTIGSFILLLGLFITYLYSHYTSAIHERIGISLYVIPALLIGHVIIYILIKKEVVLVVSLALSILYTLGTIYGAYKWGVSMPTTLLLFSLVIGIIGMLFSSRKAILATVIISALVFALGLREINHPEITSWKEYKVEIVDILSYIVIISISSGLTILSNRETEKSLKRALESEKNLEQKVEQRTQELRQSQLETISAMSKTYELGKIAQGLFHDLITPLTSVALSVSEYDKTQSKLYIDRAIKASDKMRHLIEITKNQIKEKDTAELFSVKEEIQAVVDLLQYWIRKKDIIITITGDDFFLHGISLKFNQIISNIVQNAIESFDSEKQYFIDIKIATNKLTISNNGPQIPSEILPKLMAEQITTKENHFGIGLPMIRHIIREDFNGDIKITSDQELTTFTILFSDSAHARKIPPILQKHHL